VALISTSFYKNKYQNSIHNAYNINVVFDDEKMRLDCKEALSYINTENTILNELYFHIYTNAFKDEEKVPIAESDFYVGGMEYPQIVQIDSTAYNGDKLWLEYLITHEIAHQWWYGVVGNDEIERKYFKEIFEIKQDFLNKCRNNKFCNKYVTIF
jgi:hypothetical protein